MKGISPQLKEGSMKKRKGQGLKRKRGETSIESSEF
jgi:hypothetical protein